MLAFEHFMLQSVKKYLVYALVLLLLSLFIVLTFRVPLINYLIKENAPQGVTVSIKELGLHPWSRAISIGGLELGLAEPELTLRFKQLRLSGIGVDLEPRVSWQDIQLEQLVLALKSGEQVEFSQLNLRLGAWSQEQGLVLNQLALQDIQVSTAEPELMLNLNKLSIDEIALDAQQALSIKQIQLAQTSLLLAATPELPEVALNLELLTLDTLASDLKQKFALANIELGNINVDIEAWQWQVALAQLKLEQLGIENFISSEGEDEQLSVNLDSILLTQLLWQTHVATTPLDALSLARLSLTELALAENVLALQAVDIGALLVDARRDKNALINLLPPIQTELAKADDKATVETEKASSDVQPLAEQGAVKPELVQADEAETTQAAEPLASVEKAPAVPTRADPVSNTETAEFGIKLAKLSLATAAKIRWQDQSVSPVVDQTLVINSLTLEQLSTLASDGDAHLRMAAVLGLHTKINLDSKIHPAKSPNDMQLALTVSKLELPPFSGYAQQATGYALESGQFNLDLKVQAKAAQLSGKAKLDAYNVIMRVEDEAVSERLNQELTMPLPTAIYLLEDPDKHITLSMPLKGSMDDPSFSWSGIMRFIMVKAIRKASVYYLKQALLPQTTIFSLVDMFGGMVYNKLTELPPLPFKPKQVELNKDHKTLLDQVAKTMQAKDKLNFRLCATANSADGDKAQALVLADQRVSNIRDYLSQAKGIDSGRLLSCLSKYDSEAEQSGVKIKL